MPQPLSQRRAELEQRYPIWEKRMIHIQLAYSAREFPDQELVCSADVHLTYSQVLHLAEATARNLYDLGVRPGCHVAVMMDNCAEIVVISYALSMLGATRVPLNTRQSREGLEYLLTQSNAMTLLYAEDPRRTDTSHAEFLRAVRWVCDMMKHNGSASRFPDLRAIQGYRLGTGNLLDVAERLTTAPLLPPVSDDDWGQVLPDPQPDAPADIMYTSGTTGHPKGVCLSHDMLLRSAYGSCLNRGYEKGRRVFVPLPLFHSYGYVEGLLAVSLVGGAVILQAKFQPEEALRLMEQGRANDILSVSQIIKGLLDSPDLPHRNLDALYAVYCSGTPTPRWMWEKMRDAFGVTELITGYGMTEVCGASMQTDPADDLGMVSTYVGKLLPGGVSGLPDFGGHHTRYRVINPKTGLDVPDGQEGEFVCRGNIVTTGYHNNREETAKALGHDGWLRTGDLGVRDANGYFMLTGRLKELIRISAENVSPKEIENVVDSHPAVCRSFAVGVTDVKTGEAVAVFAELREGAHCTPDELMQYCGEHMPRYKIPKYLTFLNKDDLPLTSTLKVQKFRLKEMAENRFCACTQPA